MDVNRTGPSVEVFPLRPWQLVWYCSISFFGGTGNIMVLYVIWKGGPTFRKTSYNLWLVSLATSDLLLSSVAVPNYVLSTSVYSHPRGQAGDRLCKGLTGYGMMFLLAYASTYNMAGISIERLNVVANPISVQTNLSRLSTKVKIAFAWVLACVVISPIFPGIEYSQNNAAVGNFCTFHWSSLVLQRVVYVVVFSMNYVFPLTILGYTGMRIRKHLKYQEKVLKENMRDSHSNNYLRKLEGRRRRSLRILLMVFVAFFICWTPHNVMYFCFQELGGDNSMWNTDYFQFGVLLGFSNSFVNCALYAFISDEFRGHFYVTFSGVVGLLNSLCLTCKHKKTMLREPLIESHVQIKSMKGYDRIHEESG